MHLMPNTLTWWAAGGIVLEPGCGGVGGRVGLQKVVLFGVGYKDFQLGIKDLLDITGRRVTPVAIVAAQSTE